MVVNKDLASPLCTKAWHCVALAAHCLDFMSMTSFDLQWLYSLVIMLKFMKLKESQAVLQALK